MKPAFFYNADIRNNGTARRVTDAVVQMGWLEHGFARYTRPLLNVDFSKHDLWLFIDDGRDDIPMEVPTTGVTACWLVDTHLGWETRKVWAEKFDFVFTAQKEAATALAALGINAHWLPLACLPSVDPTSAEMAILPKEKLGSYGLQRLHDVAFVGHMNFGPEAMTGNNRLDYLDTVLSAFPNSWVAFSVFFEEAAIRYARSRIGFNVSIREDLNMRFFEILSYGNCLVTNRDVVGWEELGFKDEVHFIGYKGAEDAVEKIRWALDNPMEREKIAKAGHKKARAEHTYQHRIQQMLEIMGV